MTTVIVSSGVTSSGLTISSADGLQVQSGGVAMDVDALSGSEVEILSGGQLYQGVFPPPLAGQILLEPGGLLWGDPYVPAGGELVGGGTVEG
ncbi:hypothetical protein [Phenylobacterium montanum]|uniref:Uncharacterized protein n=1 Tax=Phenylobacterium montanum TaxID=2823693 RepID=A0A975G048_9CAUL|nr:hypothetical protein [Caulobacter sp. S6]QUD87521.1 hypothetical protein KCG34_21095 [Caulobacter sp. S6]